MYILYRYCHFIFHLHTNHHTTSSSAAVTVSIKLKSKYNFLTSFVFLLNSSVRYAQIIPQQITNVLQNLLPYNTLWPQKNISSGALTSSIEGRVKNCCVDAYCSGSYFNEKLSKYRTAVSKFQMRYTLTNIRRQNGDVISLLKYFPEEVNYINWRWLRPPQKNSRMNRYFAKERLLRCSLHTKSSICKKEKCQ